MPRTTLILLGGLCLVGASLVGQQALTNDAIIKMVAAGISEDVIVSMVDLQPAQYSLTPDDLIALKQAGVSERIITAMLKKSAKTPDGRPSDAPDLSSSERSQFEEIGVYCKKGDRWVEVLPEVVNWKTGGVLKSVATLGVVKGDINGRLNGPHSRNSVTMPAEFVIRTLEGVAITEYQLLKLREKKKAREFRTITGGILHVSGGAKRDLVPFSADKIAPRTYRIVFTHLTIGEYGFLPPGLQAAQSASAQLGKMYTFRVIE